MGYLFLIVAGWAVYGIVRMMRSGAESQRYLAEAQAEAPLHTEHLTPPLAALLQETRLLRISLEAPVRQIQEFLVGDLDTASTEDLDGFDNMLMTTSRLLGDWITMVERLPENDLATFHDLGLSADPVRHALIREGWSFDRKNLRGPGGTMDKRISDVIAALTRMETQLQTTRRLYR